MLTSARCWVAVGLSLSLAVACGDDDNDPFPGLGGSGGTGGSAGNAGAAGTGGSAGSPDAGPGGTGGSTGGTGGSTAGTGGTGGSTAGTGGTGELPDAGADAAPDGGDVVVSNCPDFDVVSDGAEGQVNQQVVIGRVHFTGGNSATVTFRGVDDDGFNFAPPQVLCTGPENADCDADVQGILPGPDGGGDAVLLLFGDEESIDITGVSPAGGELALLVDEPSVPEAFAFAYLAWGADFESPDPTGGGGDSLEIRAADAGFWVEGERIELGTNNTIYILGNVDAPDAGAGGASDAAIGYGVCTQ